MKRRRVAVACLSRFRTTQARAVAGVEPGDGGARGEPPEIIRLKEYLGYPSRRWRIDGGTPPQDQSRYLVSSRALPLA